MRSKLPENKGEKNLLTFPEMTFQNNGGILCRQSFKIRPVEEANKGRLFRQRVVFNRLIAGWFCFNHREKQKIKKERK